MRVTATRWMTLAVAAGALFQVVMSSTLVSVALPTIGLHYRASAAELQWIVVTYVLVYASLLIAGGTLAERHGYKRIFILGLVVFGVGSTACGLAPSTWMLLAARALQGLGTALVTPGSLTIIRATFDDPRERATAIGLWSMASGLSLAVGPTLGGVLVQSLGWRWVFWANAPLTAMLVVLTIRFVPRPSSGSAHRRWDWPGALLTIVGVGALAYGVIHGGVVGLGSSSVLACFALGVLALSLFVVWERRHPEPLVDVSLFLHARFTAVNVATLIVFFAFVGAIVYFSAFFQDVRHRSPIEAGVSVSAIGVGSAICSSLSGRLIEKVGSLVPMVAGLVLAGVSALLLLRLSAGAEAGATWWNFALLGAGIGTCLPPMTHVAVSAVDVSQAQMASATHSAFRQVGQVFGVAVLGLLVYAHLPQGAGTSGPLDQADAARFVAGLHSALWVSGLALLGAAALVTLLFWYQSRAEGHRRALATAPTHSSPSPTM